MTATEALIPDASGPGFVSIEAHRFRPLLGEGALSDWTTFAGSWNHLETDLYMADGARSRRRRFASFHAAKDVITREPHGPHFQSRDYNALNGGVDRWFEPITEQIAKHAVTMRLLTLCVETFTRARGEARSQAAWKIEMHQFRIEPTPNSPGKPTPEGMHRDGVEWVFVALVARVNVAGGITTVGDARGRPLGKFTLIEPLDAVFLDDTRVRHGVTPIEVLEPGRPAHRDALVLTFRSVRG